VTASVDLAICFPAGQRVRVDISLVGSRTLHEWGTVAALAGKLLTIRVATEGGAHEAFADGGRQLLVRTGVTGRAYLCRGEVVAFADDQLILTMTGEMFPDEQREYFRLDTSLSLDYSVYAATPGWDFPAQEAGPRRSEVVNISGGGCKARTSRPLPQGELVKISVGLPHPEPQTVSAVAQVVYCEPASSDGFTVGLCYVEINERQRDSIIRFINTEELHAKRRAQRPLTAADTFAASRLTLSASS
jgi:PilZ domain-containing protein/PilZN1 domain-containing protein